jgi:hypothetical protein
MNLEKYPLKSDQLQLTFEFESIGPQGKVRKMIQYNESEIPHFFHLGFGDLNPETGEVDDLAVTNNGDTLKILVTVASTIYVFTKKYPQAWVYAIGSNNARTRLYRIGISKYIASIQHDFEIFGLKDTTWVSFQKEEDYTAFLIKRK